MSETHSIGRTIASLRKEKGWTQLELAEKLQISDKTVSKWEMDGGVPSIEFFPALADLFGVSTDYLIRGNLTTEKATSVFKSDAKMNDEIRAIVEREYLKDGVLKIEEFEKISYDNALAPYAKEILDSYPIHETEKFIHKIERETNKTLFRSFLDEGNVEYAQLIVDGNREEILKCEFNKIKSIPEYATLFCGGAYRLVSIKREECSNFPQAKVLGYHLFHALKEAAASKYKVSVERLSVNALEAKYYAISMREITKDALVRTFALAREEIYANLSLRLKKQELTDGMSKQYFFDLIEKGEVDTCVIKLCVKLEAILASDYRLEGALVDMLNAYWAKQAYPDLKRQEVLTKLRAYRNCLVHAEYSDVTLSASQLKECVEYVFAMEKNNGKL